MPETDTVDVLPHLRELRDTWRRQDFKFSSSQSEEYRILLQARRERVAEFYRNGCVSKGRSKSED